MNKQQKIKIISDLVNQYIQLDQCWDNFHELVGAATDSKLGGIIWKSFDNYVDAAALAVGYSSDDLSWFIWDNKCGKKQLKFNSVKIKNVKTFVDVLEKWIKEATQD